MNLRQLFSSVESAVFLDGSSAALQKTISRAVDGTGVAALLRGKWLGHPVHPVLVTIPLGTWTVTPIFDFVYRDEQAARRLIGLGLMAAPSALVTGWVDWSERDVRQRRVGLVHAGANALAIALLFASYRRRACSTDVAAKVLSGVAVGVLGVAGALGGHLTYAQGAGVQDVRAGVGSSANPVPA